jgi:hypothetical protein
MSGVDEAASRLETREIEASASSGSDGFACTRWQSNTILKVEHVKAT